MLEITTIAESIVEEDVVAHKHAMLPSIRALICFLLFLTTSMAYSQRGNLAISIVAMVNSTASKVRDTFELVYKCL